MHNNVRIYVLKYRKQTNTVTDYGSNTFSNFSADFGFPLDPFNKPEPTFY